MIHLFDRGDDGEGRVYLWIVAGCFGFVALTMIAMGFYPGGTYFDWGRADYAFFHNFLSDLGRTEAYGGEPNWASLMIFVVALLMGGGGLVTFFLAFPQFFRATRLGRVLAVSGSLCGVVAGLAFVGVGLAPSDVAKSIHMAFVIWAFRAFPVAVTLYLAAILISPDFPNRYGVIFALFGLLLIAYLGLLYAGPDTETPHGILIQATAQKLIVYASVVSVAAQSLVAYRVLRRESATAVRSCVRHGRVEYDENE